MVLGVSNNKSKGSQKVPGVPKSLQFAAFGQFVLDPGLIYLYHTLNILGGVAKMYDIVDLEN